MSAEAKAIYDRWQRELTQSHFDVLSPEHQQRQYVKMLDTMNAWADLAQAVVRAQFPSSKTEGDGNGRP